MNATRTQREIELREEIADLNKRIACGMPAHLDIRRSNLSRELSRLIATRLIQPPTEGYRS